MLASRIAPTPVFEEFHLGDEQLVEIRVLDHLIVAGGEVLSFAEKGLL